MGEHNHDHECTECGCGCGHDNNANGETMSVTLTLDDGKELECAVLSIFEAVFEGIERKYIALLPVESLEGEEGEVYLYRFTKSESDEMEIFNIETDEEYDIAADAFDEMLDTDEFDEIFEEEEL